jgi:uncharacterized membrane protein YjjP (DUF1212 family)
MKFSHYWTFVILICIVGAAIASIIEGNWGEFGMCITAFGGWMMVARYEYLERKFDETFSG